MGGRGERDTRWEAEDMVKSASLLKVEIKNGAEAGASCLAMGGWQLGSLAIGWGLDSCWLSCCGFRFP